MDVCFSLLHLQPEFSLQRQCKLGVVKPTVGDAWIEPPFVAFQFAFLSAFRAIQLCIFYTFAQVAEWHERIAGREAAADAEKQSIATTMFEYSLIPAIKVASGFRRTP